MKVADFDYHLPPELIAQTPVEPRDASRLLVVDRATGEFHHRRFREIGEFLAPGDLLVVNDSRVIRARLLGRRAPGGGRVEVFLLRRLAEPGEVWECLVRPGRRVHPGVSLVFGEGRLSGSVRGESPGGKRRIAFASAEGDPAGWLERLGEVPLPPYITAPLSDGERYQTVYARHKGSVAAPTAGLHFTPELLDKLEAQGVRRAALTLHVGLGTFRPVRAETVEEHAMHSEYYELPAETAEAVNAAHGAGKRVVAVGTTACRTLETVARKAGENGELAESEGWTDLFIYPGYRFRAIDALLTNFHLPRSTLLMLVSAFAGRDLILRAYAEAIRERYRFYSFGDAMLIL
ncbi:MAG TPA: tRNA preQ1(34) S-adenosylmethionine ribosyltransferase-isomerase QueA [Firmicutes bacterium]|nr:tRNA preQ1(34) S-adenosylmethionine ribosyltransferase-isomerase QueA [Bacillota bacterium]